MDASLLTFIAEAETSAHIDTMTMAISASVRTNPSVPEYQGARSKLEDDSGEGLSLRK